MQHPLRHVRTLRALILIAALAACGGDPGVTIGDFPHATSGGGNDAAVAQGPLDAGAAPGGGGGTGGSTGVPVPPVISDAATSNDQPDACQEHVVDGANPTPDMLIVLDRSGSMNPGNNEQMADRWTGSRTAVQQVTAAFDDRVNFGLMTFPGPSSGGGRDNDNCSMGVLNVPIGRDKGDAIASALSGMNADGRTPTALALQEALRVLGMVNSGPDQLIIPKYVLLVTDGDPNCSGAGGMRNVDDAARMQTIAAIDALRMAGIKTFVVGYQTASSNFVDQLDRMAQAGGTGAMTHRSVENGDDLAATISDLAKKAVSCAYQLESAVSDPSRVLVTVGGTPRNRDQADGWKLESDQRTVTLTGAACEDLQQGKLFKVEVKCEVLPIF